jgi:hypothetical protein
MKCVVLSALLLLLAADARPRQLIKSESDNKLSALRRQLPKKAKKGDEQSTPRATPDDDKKGCTQTKIVRLYEDLNNPNYVVKSNEAIGSQDFVNVPIYDLNDDATVGDVVGKYQGVLTYVPGGDCVGSYMWSFDYDQASGTYRTQFYTPLTCLGLSNPVSGSVGDVVGATGELSLCGNVLNNDKDETIGEILCLVTCSSSD